MNDNDKNKIASNDNNNNIEENKSKEEDVKDKKTYKKLEEIISTDSTDYIKDLILQIKSISSFFQKIDPTSQNIYTKLSKEYELIYKRVKNKLYNLTKKLCLLTWKDKSEINIDSYDDVVKNVEDMLEMVSRNIDIIKGLVKESPEEDISKELLKIKKEKLKDYKIAKAVNLDNDVFDIDNSYYPFIPKLSEKPNAIEPLEQEIIDATKLRNENKEKLKLKYEDSKNKSIQKYLYNNPYTKEIETFCINKENELTSLEDKYRELKENISEMEDDDNNDNEDSIKKNDIIKFVDVNSIEEKINF